MNKLIAIVTSGILSLGVSSSFADEPAAKPTCYTLDQVKESTSNPDIEFRVLTEVEATALKGAIAEKGSAVPDTAVTLVEAFVEGRGDIVVILGFNKDNCFDGKMAVPLDTFTEAVNGGT